MTVEDLFLLFDTSNNVDISIRNYDGFWVVRKIVQIIELLDLIGLVFEVKEVAVSFLDGEYGDLFNLMMKIGWLSDRNTPFTGLI